MSLRERIQVTHAGWTDEDAIDLRARQQNELRAMSTPEPGQIPTESDVPVFLVLKVDGQPVACGGLRPLLSRDGEPTREVEIKRMYVVPELRGQAHGVADCLMEQLEAQALRQGWSTFKVETGRDMPRARRFYQRHGYDEIPLYGHYVGAANSVCYEKSRLQ